ncbi:putative DNA-binding transcriptional regulator AlpA [Bradyrhizobium japonicum]
MTSAAAPSCQFYPIAVVREIVPFSIVTMWRMEKQGRFPKRIKVANRKVVWRKSEVEAWQANPEEWRAPPAEAAA